MTVYRIDQDFLPLVWPEIKGLVARACSYHPFLEPDDILYGAAYGKLKVLVLADPSGIQAFAAAEVVQYPTKRVANVVAAGGKPGALKAMSTTLLAELEQFAREFGADFLSVTGRPGWKRFARGEKYSHGDFSIAWKELGDVRRRRFTDHSYQERSLGPGAASLN